jgi:hypothetical protein
MPARKNRHDKYRGQPKTSKRSPSDAMAIWLGQNPGYMATKLHGGPSWELMSRNYSVYGGFYATINWSQAHQGWGITHNSTSPRDYPHKEIGDAVAWYNSRVPAAQQPKA